MSYSVLLFSLVAIISVIYGIRSENCQAKINQRKHTENV